MYKGIEINGRTLFSSQRFRISPLSKLYYDEDNMYIMQILAFNGKHMVKMVVEFHYSVFRESLFRRDTYLEFLRRKNQCRILLLQREYVPFQ